MDKPALDILLNETFFGLVAALSVIGALVLGSILFSPNVLMTTTSKVWSYVGLFICVLIILVIVFTNPPVHTYQLLRQQSAPPTWETYYLAKQFNYGRFYFGASLMVGCLVLVLAVMIALVPIFLLVQDFSGIIESSIIISILIVITLFVLPFFGNCTLYWITQQFQYINFGEIEDPITLTPELDRHYGNKCGAITVDDIQDIAHHPFAKPPNPFIYIWDETNRLKSDATLAWLFRPNLIWLSPTADIVSMLFFIWTVISAIIVTLKNHQKKNREKST